VKEAIKIVITDGQAATSIVRIKISVDLDLVAENAYLYDQVLNKRLV
jgi:hypothetical protein